MAAGATMSHPSLPAIIITPICPHSLSFRPILVPAGVHLKIRLAQNVSRTGSELFETIYSVDGSCNKKLLRDNYLLITTSQYPLPSICRNDQINDWFEGLALCLNWNQRPPQLPFLDSSYIKNMPLPFNYNNDNQVNDC